MVDWRVFGRLEILRIVARLRVNAIPLLVVDWCNAVMGVTVIQRMSRKEWGVCVGNGLSIGSDCGKYQGFVCIGGNGMIAKRCRGGRRGGESVCDC